MIVIFNFLIICITYCSNPTKQIISIWKCRYIFISTHLFFSKNKTKQRINVNFFKKKKMKKKLIFFLQSSNMIFKSKYLWKINKNIFFYFKSNNFKIFNHLELIFFFLIQWKMKNTTNKLFWIFWKKNNDISNLKKTRFQP